MSTKFNWMRTGLLVLALSAGACGSSSNNANHDAAGGNGGSGGSGGSGGIDAGMEVGPGVATTIAGCAALGGSAQAVGDCIINLPTDSVGQSITTTPTIDYTACRM
jgi:hypothetical protein